MSTASNVVPLPLTRKPRLEGRLRAACDFVGEFEPLTYVVAPILRTSSMYTITAKTGSGKTGFAVIAALAVASGRHDILNRIVEKGRVIYCAFENPDDVRMRLMAAAWMLRVDLAALRNELLVLDARSKPEDLVTMLDDATRTGPLSLVIIDTFAAAFDSSDVNDNVQSGEYVRRLRPITQLDGLPAVLIAAHPTKNASDDQLVPYGAGAILNEVDGNLTLAKKSAESTVLHHQGKFRGLEFAPIPFRFEIVETPSVTDNKGRSVALPVLRPCTSQELEHNAHVEVDRKIRVLRAMKENPKATQRELASLLGTPKSTIGRIQSSLMKSKLLEKDPLRVDWRLTAKGEREAASLDN